MSIEKAIEANTLALQNLLAALTSAARSTGCADKGSELPVFTPETTVLTTKELTAAKAGAKTLNEAEEKEPLTYDELRTDFLKLVKTNKSAALNILASFNVDSLLLLKDKPTFYPAIAAKIAEANNG